MKRLLLDQRHGQGAKGRYPGLRSQASSLLRLLLATQLFLWPALAVTYSTNQANGPETLSATVTQAFEDWQALDTKLEVSEVEDNPESRFQYGEAERFSPDMLSVTIQRQQDTRQLIHLVNPNADNQRRILLHEVGIAIGLTAQVPPALQNTLPETPETPSQDSESSTESTAEEAEGLSEQTTGEQTPTQDTTTEETTAAGSETTESSEETQEGAGDEGAGDEGADDDGTSDESTGDNGEAQTETTEGSSEPSETTDSNPTETTPAETTPAETTPAETSTDPEALAEPESNPLEASTSTSTIQPWETVMNPGVTPNDSSTLGEGEKELLKVLNLFAKEDINKDGNVNFYDLVALSQAFGQRNVNDPADINRDGLVNQADVDLLRKVYVFSEPSATAPGETEANPEGQTGPEVEDPPLEENNPEETE